MKIELIRGKELYYFSPVIRLIFAHTEIEGIKCAEINYLLASLTHVPHRGSVRGSFTR